MAKINFKNVLDRARRGVRVVLHDPEVDRAGKKLALIIAVRGIAYLGGSAATVELLIKLVGALGGTVSP